MSVGHTSCSVRRWRPWLWQWCRLVVCSVVSGCAALAPAPQQAYDTVLPKTAPVRNVTSFSDSLRCMDALLLEYGLGAQGSGKSLLTSQGILDKTGRNLGDDNREVLIATVAKLAARSEAFVFVNYNPRELDELLQHLKVTQRRDFALANYELIGAITQLDDNVSAASLGLSAFGGPGELGYSKDQLVTVLGVDFSVSHAVSRQVISGITASNRIAVARRGTAVEGGGHIKKAGILFHVALEQNEGLGAALRTLVELSTIEVLGKLAKVPYWQCLQIEQTNPEVLALTADWFQAMSEGEQVTFVQRVLRQHGSTDVTATGTLDAPTRAAIARYQAAVGLTPSGRIDLALYRQLVSQEGRLTRPPPLTLTLTTPRGTAPVFAVNEQLTLRVETSQDAYVYCYYRDGHQRVMQVYPNPFQPTAYVRAHQPVSIPAAPHFTLLLDTPQTTEDVLCLASTEDLAIWLPQPLRAALTALPVTQLPEIPALIRPHHPPALAEARLTVQVQ